MEHQRVEHKVRTVAVRELDNNMADYEKEGWEFAGITDGFDKTTRILILKRPFNWPHSDALRKFLDG